MRKDIFHINSILKKPFWHLSVSGTENVSPKISWNLLKISRKISWNLLKLTFQSLWTPCFFSVFYCCASWLHANLIVIMDMLERGRGKVACRLSKNSDLRHSKGIQGHAIVKWPCVKINMYKIIIVHVLVCHVKHVFCFLIPT